MADRSTIIVGRHVERGRLFAAVDPAARYCSSAVAEMRFAALLTPFKSLADAEAALIHAGAQVVNGLAQ